ncbi:putative cytochrome B5-like protein [Cotonvirus japonicus]|uniref:Cytochrome B5-like protein n=1 Tax=Cotonvirus japonicus TaxID=2811091 RepID=A0ABM7NTF7_9VIRU|nr:putative cytochrome B5-like protein [Cotonvirus japonicus]BCS83455.1 putative cytochrome B5-like protein [Cotonvirus japonicus]
MTYYYLILLIVVYVIKIVCKYIHQKRQMEENLQKKSNETVNEKIIVTFKGDKYDITDFLKKHPGGKNVLIENNHKDIEQIMMDYGHSNNAYRMLQRYKINESEINNIQN